ncbi:MAG TPA: hypothetical protein VK879_01465 [Candidatus Sulfomarinibacteraceae bacterium]|nr:hypothetical protein [Candidatus Sulfomarinibacteraceae bacterium]
MRLSTEWDRLELNGGRVRTVAPDTYRLELPPTAHGYADAQFHDYAGRRRSNYEWRPGTVLRLRARFSRQAGELAGTAGFGFWNAPFGPGTGLTPALPQATWFFYASAPSDLPLAPVDEAGRGWFAATIDAGTWSALTWAPVAPAVLLLNQFALLRRRLWPLVRHALNISFASIDVDLREWHEYRLAWQENGCFFQVDGAPLLATPFSPRGPLGFVCWIDNQYLVATPRGRVRWGVLPLSGAQWMEVAEMTFDDG